MSQPIYNPPGPRSLKEPGAPDWCWQTIGMLKRYLANIEDTWREAAEVVGELEETQAWKVLGYASFSKLCEEQLGMPARVVLSRIDKERIKAARKQGRPSLEDVAALSHPGHPGEKGNNITFSLRGTDPTYVIARLKRDRPDLAQKVIDGKMSPNAAAIEAGFRHKTIIVRADDPAAAIRSLLRRYSREDLLAALVLPTEGNS